jgi:hypothetical protein
MVKNTVNTRFHSGHTDAAFLFCFIASPRLCDCSFVIAA